MCNKCRIYTFLVKTITAFKTFFAWLRCFLESMYYEPIFPEEDEMIDKTK